MSSQYTPRFIGNYTPQAFLLFAVYEKWGGLRMRLTLHHYTAKQDKIISTWYSII